MTELSKTSEGKGLFALFYGIIAYTLFGLAMVWLVAFCFNLAGAYSLDRPRDLPTGIALAVNAGLFVMFGLQHSVMARTSFKRWWTRYMPIHLERSTYVILGAAATVLFLYFWQPIPGALWVVETPWIRGMLFAIAGCGWLLIVVSSFQFDHWHLLGLRQVMEYWRGLPQSAPSFAEPILYRIVRHPMMVGYFLAFWTTPDMTASRVVFAAGMTVYILIAIPFEERDLIGAMGQSYKEYRNRVPCLIPAAIRPRKARKENPR